MKKVSLISLISGLVLSSGAYIAFIVAFPLKNNELKDLTWDTRSPMIAFNNIHREDKDGLLILRLTDGKEQFIAGDWNTSFNTTGDILALGEFPPGYSSTTGQHLYAIQEGSRISSIQLKELNGKAISVKESDNKAYFLLEMKKDSETSFCIIEWEKVPPSGCKLIQLPAIQSAEWDISSDHIVIAQTASGTVYQIDPWNQGIEKPQPIEASKTESALAQLNKDKNPSEKKALYHVLNVVVFKTGKTWKIHRVPWFASVNWLDKEHFLITQKDRQSIYELKTNSIASLISDKDIGTKTPSYRK